MNAVNLLILEKMRKSDTGRIPVHAHPFWQLELALGGPIGVWLDCGQDVLQEGEMLLIPPGTDHAFLYEKPDCAWITIKFECEPKAAPEPKVHRLPRSRLNEKWISLMETIVSEPVLTRAEKMFVEGLLQSLCRHLAERDAVQETGSEPPFVRSVMDRVREQGGRPVGIGQLAEEMGYTRGYLSAQFRTASGESLKSFIDRTRLDKAKELLLYSESVIAEVAESLGFKDLFSFSRFFKKGAGVSPRAFRQRHRLREQG